jgi:hypothetical protein
MAILDLPENQVEEKQSKANPRVHYGKKKNVTRSDPDSEFKSESEDESEPESSSDSPDKSEDKIRDQKSSSNSEPSDSNSSSSDEANASVKSAMEFNAELPKAKRCHPEEVGREQDNHRSVEIQ